jgi:hypothetical protein
MTATEILVFGSNLAGRHGKGAALAAVQQYGAIYGQGHGRQGNAYAIPTKGFGVGARGTMPTLPLPMIQYFCRVFLDHARACPGDTFRVTPIGCGLAGYKPPQIAPFFNYAPINVILPYEFIY